MAISGQKTLRSIGTLVTGSLAQSVLKIGMLALFARLLSPEEFGVYNAALVVIGFVLLFNELGIAAAIVQKKEINEKTVSTGFFASIFLGVIMGIATYFSSNLVSDFFKVPELSSILKVVSLLFFIEAFGITSKGILQREMKFKAIVWIELISFIAGYALIGAILAYLGFSYWALIYSTIAQAIIRTTLSLKLSGVNPSKGFSFVELNSLLGFGSGFTLARTFNYFALNSDNFVISRFIGTSALGFYGRAYQIMVFPSTLIGGAIDKVFYATFSEFGRAKDSRVNNYYLVGLGLSLIFSNLIACIFFFNSELIVTVLLGSAWMEVAPPLQFLALGLLFRLSYKMNISIIRSEGWVMRYAFSQVIYFMFVIIGSLLVWDEGIKAIAIIVSLAIMGNYWITLIIASRAEALNLSQVLKVNLKALSICAVMWVMSYGVYHVVESFMSSASVMVRCITPTVMFFFLSFCLFLDKNFLQVIKKIRG